MELSETGLAGPVHLRFLLSLLDLAIGPIMRYISFWLIAAEFGVPWTGHADVTEWADGGWGGAFELRGRLVVEEELRSWPSSGVAIGVRVDLGHLQHAQWSPARLSWAGPAGPRRPRALLTLLGLAIGPMMRYISFWLVAAEFVTP